MQIVLPAPVYFQSILFRHLPNDLGRDAHNQAGRRNYGARSDNSPGGDDGTGAHHCSIENNSPHRDQTVRLHSTTVQDSPMADTDPVANEKRMFMGDME